MPVMVDSEGEYVSFTLTDFDAANEIVADPLAKHARRIHSQTKSASTHRNCTTPSRATTRPRFDGASFEFIQRLFNARYSTAQLTGTTKGPPKNLPTSHIVENGCVFNQVTTRRLAGALS